MRDMVITWNSRDSAHFLRTITYPNLYRQIYDKLFPVSAVVLSVRGSQCQWFKYPYLIRWHLASSKVCSVHYSCGNSSIRSQGCGWHKLWCLTSKKYFCSASDWAQNVFRKMRTFQSF
ncbi:unnamed protein product [Ixodes persulcatus]